MAATDDGVETVCVRGHPMPLTALDSFGAYQGWARRFALHYPPGLRRMALAVACSITAAVGWCYYRVKMRLVILYLHPLSGRVRYGTRYRLTLCKLWCMVFREWWGERPRLRELARTFEASVDMLEAAERAEEEAREAEEARHREERAAYVLRRIFGAEEMTPDDIGPHYFEN